MQLGPLIQESDVLGSTGRDATGKDVVGICARSLRRVQDEKPEKPGAGM
jgi:hypothetical protein